VNVVDPSGECTKFNISCWIDNELHILDIEASSNGAASISPKGAVEFLVSNGFKVSDARAFVSSWSIPPPTQFSTSRSRLGEP
jgi:hypothetical protein